MGTFVPPAQRDKLIWLAVDFDGTIAESTWSPENPNAVPGPPIEHSVSEINRCVAEGWKIAIHTSRSWAGYELIEKYMIDHNIPFHKIICGKLLAHRYIDDRNSDLNGRWI